SSSLIIISSMRILRRFVPFHDPIGQATDDHRELYTFLGQSVLNPRRGLRVDFPLDHFSLVQLVQPLGETRRANVLDSSFEFVESGWLLEAQSMDDRQGPYLGKIVPGGV